MRARGMESVNVEVLHCPACGEEISRHDPSPVLVRGRVSTRASAHTARDAMAHMIAEANALHEQAVQITEGRVRQHFAERHRFRYWLYRKTGWTRALSFAGARW